MSTLSEIFKVFQDLYNSRKHLLEMIEDRGYNIDHLKNYTSDDIKTMFHEHINGNFGISADIGPLDILVEKNQNNPASAEKMYVKYRMDPKFKGTSSFILQITDIYQNHLAVKDTLVIININRVLMKIGAKDKLDEEYVNDLYVRKNYFVQLFGIENFLLNISKHQIVPKHRVLSKQETLDILEKFKCDTSNLLTIKRDDPQAKYIGLRLKQVCEIEVENMSAGITKRYRLCVS